MAKIFGIGLPRTGTASLSEALQILGYKTKHYPKYIDIAKKYEASADTPICNCFEKLDETCPGSKFILTTREIVGWLDSCHKASKRFRWRFLHPDARCGPEVYQAHIDLFGTTSFVRDRFIDGYAKHFKRVFKYFDHRDDLLIFNVREGWRPLCDFLQKPMPTIEFPHRNASEQNT